jgi:hypothetical protein
MVWGDRMKNATDLAFFVIFLAVLVVAYPFIFNRKDDDNDL